MKNPLKLAVASGIFHPESGGPATYLYQILPQLQQRQWDVRLVSYGDAVSNSAYPYPVRRIPRRALPLRLAHYALAAYPLLRWADLVYMHTLDLPLLHHRAPRVIKIVGDPAWERAIRKGWIPPTTDIDDFQQADYGAFVRSQQQARNRQMQAVSGVIVPSTYLKRMVIGWGVPEDRIHVIYNAIGSHTAPNASPLTRDGARRTLGLDDAPTLLTAARLTAWKGVDHLLAALASVPGVRLLVAGDGPERARLETLADDLGLAGRITFLGQVSREQMPLYMKAADYLALYSGYEGLSHTLLESLVAGTPVIASDKGGNPEVVQHGVNGLLVPYVDVEALAAAIVEAFQPGKRDALAAHSQTGMERFTFGGMVAETDAVLRSYAALA